MKLAIVYDWADKFGGAERILSVLRQMYPNADWYTSAVDVKRAPWARAYHFHTSFLQGFPLWIRRSRLLSFFLYPLAFESFDFSGYDMVLTITSSFAKGIITRPGTRHICYLLTPTRWLWDDEVFAVGESKFGLLGLFLRLVRRRLQRWDSIAAQRVDEFMCISKEVQDRCFRYYKRESTLIYPYFDETYWQGLISPKPTVTDSASSTVLVHDKSKGEKCTIHTPYFLVVSRLEIYKRIDLAIQAFKLLQQSKELEGYSLVIVGTGSQARQLRQLAGRDHRIIFLTEVTDRDLAKLYRAAVALVMPQKEDFGYTACEAIACACPVVCFALGGQTEIVENGLQGQHFHEQTPSAIAKSLVQTSKLRYNRDSYENSHIRRWGRDTFVAAFTKKIPQTV